MTSLEVSGKSLQRKEFVNHDCWMKTFLPRYSCSNFVFAASVLLSLRRNLMMIREIGSVLSFLFKVFLKPECAGVLPVDIRLLSK